MQLVPLAASALAEWRVLARERIAEKYRRSGLRVGADADAYADRLLAELLPQGAGRSTSQVLAVSDRGREVGTVWLGVNAGKAFVIDVDLDVDTIGVSAAGRVFERIERTARDGGATRLSIALTPEDRAGHALIGGRGFTVASIQMLIEPLPARDSPPRISVQPMTPERFAAYLAASEEVFADDLVASGRFTRDEALAESRRQLRIELPEGLDSPGQSLFTASAGGDEVGVLWVGARLRDEHPHAFVLDVEVAEHQRRRGYGRELMLAAEREARAIGADSVGLHVFGFNVGAIALYEQLGYRRVEESLFLDIG